MSKAVTKNTHWLPKTGSYTIRLNRRGDIGETLPKEAGNQLFTELQERGNRAQAEVAHINAMLPNTCGDENKAALMKRKFQLEAELRNLRFEKHMAFLPTYAQAFMAAARMLLDEKAILQIDAVVIDKVGVPPRHWQRFLSENGFGRVDSSTYKK
jgi:hypothetical protein